MQEERIAETLQQEGEWRIVINGKIVGQVTYIRIDMQEFVNKQLLG
jgi:hypothetical protein